MTAAEYNQLFQKRTKIFALGIIKLSETLPNTTPSFAISKQLIRSATSLAANYRASCIARSDRGNRRITFWLEMLLEGNIAEKAILEIHVQEATELLKVFMSYRSSLKSHLVQHGT
jgi:hypothetical protein